MKLDRNLSNLEQSDDICPDCGSMLYYYPEATSPDDYDMKLICKDCGYSRE